MRVFVYEHMCSGALAGHGGADSLHAEGKAMLLAALQDFSLCPGVETVTLLDPRLTASGTVVHAAGAVEEESAFRQLARTSDYTLVIAPETGGVLGQRCKWVEEEGGRLLGPSSSAVRLAADKLALAKHLSDAGIPTPVTHRYADRMNCPFSFPVVLKPRDGAGSVGTLLVHSRDEWRAARKLIESEGCYSELVVQPFVRGKAVGVALLAGRERTVLLLPAAQHLSSDGRFHYQGGSAPLPVSEAERACRLAERAVTAVPVLSGFVGVDIVLSHQGEHDDIVIEINPRLTTSYVGLRILARFNIAAAMLTLVEGGKVPDPVWKSGVVNWHADGRVVGPYTDEMPVL
jgi:hypothetical protein